MTIFGGADEVVILNSHAVPKSAIGGCDLVHELFRRQSGGRGGALDLLPVLVGAGEEQGFNSQRAMPACDGVACNCGVSVSNVWTRVHVVNRGGDVEAV